MHTHNLAGGSMEGEDVPELPLLLSLPPDLLSLPPDLLTLSASKVKEKAALRLTCRATRMAVGAACTQLKWWGDKGAGPVSLTALLPASCPNIKLLNCVRMWESLVDRVGCPSTMQTLICHDTGVADLGPLAACTGLWTLNCDVTPVGDLGRLAACTRLQALNCSNTKVANLGPLTACQTLECDFTPVSALGPLAACTGLQTLSRSDTEVADLGPLEACTRLQSLWCVRTQVSDLRPLAAFPLL